MEDTKPKTYVFVLMPFNREFSDVYEVGIKQACKDAGAYCERVDEQIFDENILERVYNQISKADIIVAEMTGRNPNVFYEVGYAHALNKRVILLTQSADDIPFDLKHYPHIVYGGKIATLKSELEVRIRWSIENPKSSLYDVDISLEFYINGVLLKDAPVVTAVYQNDTRYERDGWRAVGIGLPIYIHNSSNMLINPSSFSLAMIVPEYFKVDYSPANVELPDKRHMRTFNLSRPLFPDSWHSLENPFYVNETVLPNAPFDVLLRMYTELGPRDFPFRVTLEASA